MSNSFLGRSRPLLNDDLIKWASDGFPSDKLWNAPVDTIVDTAYEFIEFRDLTLHRMKVLNQTIQCLPGTSDDNPHMQAVQISHTARLHLATLIMRFSTLSTNMSSQELQAYYLLESMRRYPSSETREAIRLTGYCLVDIVEYFFRLGNSREHPLDSNKIMKLASSIISRSLDEIRTNEQEMYETYLRAWELLRRAEDWINRNKCRRPPPIMVPLTAEKSTEPVPDAFGYESYIYGKTVELVEQPPRDPEQPMGADHTVPWSSDQKIICDLVKKLEDIRRCEDTGARSVEPTDANSRPDIPADVAASANTALTQAVPVSNDATPALESYPTIESNPGASTDRESAASPLAVVQPPLHSEKVGAELSVKTKKAKRKKAKAKRVKAKKVEAENAATEEVDTAQSGAEKGACIPSDPSEEQYRSKPEHGSWADTMQAEADAAPNTTPERPQNKQSKKDAPSTTDPFEEHYGSSKAEHGSWADAMRAEIESVVIGAKGWETDWAREDAKGKRKASRIISRR
ncbi:hypothetical protein HBI17_152970 [Parastagonospora nodorum]|nr:hypothetical protein HBI17_152970 [Parastagonospora nodorum]